ncbi:hypothetical protein EV127DRAFT_168873 [Xylaria flabelliformis]|nr:hypothetical protein EV127DRAFT_168873 [Xylaria flabelliformis]
MMDGWVEQLFLISLSSHVVALPAIRIIQRFDSSRAAFRGTVAMPVLSRLSTYLRDRGCARNVTCTFVGFCLHGILHFSIQGKSPFLLGHVFFTKSRQALVHTARKDSEISRGSLNLRDLAWKC